MKKILLKSSILLAFLFSLLSMVYSQTQSPLRQVNTLATSLLDTLTIVVGLLNIVAFIAYIWLIISFLIKRSKGDANGMEQLKGMLGWGVVAMFFLVAVWGLVWFMSSSFGIALGGCASRPSPIPGKMETDNCGNAPNTPSNGGAVNASVNGTARPQVVNAVPARGPSSPTAQTVVPVSGADDEQTACLKSGGNWIVQAYDSYCFTGTVNNPNAPAPAAAAAPCSSGTPVYSGGKTLLYCQSGTTGDSCMSGSCSSGNMCSVDIATDADSNKSYGICKAI